MTSVYITRKLPAIAEKLLSKHFKVVSNKKNTPISAKKLIEAVEKYGAILSTVADKFSADVIGKKKKLQVISNYAVGLDNVDLEFAQKSGVAVYNTPDVVTESTADMTFALLLSFIRKTEEARDFVKKDKWAGWDPEIFLGEELSGKNFGIVGFGRVGKAVARRAAGFGLTVITCDGPAELAEVLEKSDYISIHAPLQSDTKYMFNKKAFALMKKKPILINMARGAIVDTSALVSALKTGRIRGACLDVVDPEPLRGKHPLARMNNVMITPHIGTATAECRLNMARRAAENIINHFSQKNT